MQCFFATSEGGWANNTFEVAEIRTAGDRRSPRSKIKRSHIRTKGTSDPLLGLFVLGLRISVTAKG